MSSSPTSSTTPSPSPSLRSRSPSASLLLPQPNSGPRSDDSESLSPPEPWETERAQLLRELGVQARMLERRWAQASYSEQAKTDPHQPARFQIETMKPVHSYGEAYRILGLDPWSPLEETARVIEELYSTSYFELDPKTVGAMFFILASAGDVQDPHLAAILAALHARELELHSAKIYQAFNIDPPPNEAPAESERAASPEPVDHSSTPRSVQNRGTQTGKQRHDTATRFRPEGEEDHVAVNEVREELRRNAQTSAVLLQAVQEVKEALHAGGGQIADELEHLQAAVRRATHASDELVPTKSPVDSDWPQKYEQLAGRALSAVEGRDARIRKLEEEMHGMSKSTDSRRLKAEARVAQSMVESLTCQRDAQTVTAAESDRRIKSLEAEARNRNIEAYNKDVEITRLRGEVAILRADISSSSNRTEGSTSDEQEGLKGVVVSQSEEISRLEMLLDSQKHNFVSRDLLNGVTVKSEATAEQLRAKVASLETKLATAKGDATFWYSEHEKRGEWLTSVAGPRMQEEKAKVAALLDENLKLKHALARLSHAAALPAVASPTTLTLPGWNGMDQFLHNAFSR